MIHWLVTLDQRKEPGGEFLGPARVIAQVASQLIQLGMECRGFLLGKAALGLVLLALQELDPLQDIGYGRLSLAHV
jgi:hypothetical protein